MSEFAAIALVALTVTNLEQRVPWHTGLFGSDPVLDEDAGPFRRVAWRIGGTVLDVTQVPDLHSTEPFNERWPGLDRLAFGGANRDELQMREDGLHELGTPNGWIVDMPHDSALSFRGPDNIARAFFAPRGEDRRRLRRPEAIPDRVGLPRRTFRNAPPSPSSIGCPVRCRCPIDRVVVHPMIPSRRRHRTLCIHGCSGHRDLGWGHDVAV